MTDFEKLLIGAAESVILARDCTHASEYPTSAPCNQCTERERAAAVALNDAVINEADRRFLLTLRQLGRYPVTRRSP